MHLPPLVVPISTIDLLSQEMIDNVIDALYEGIDPEALWRFTKQHIYSYPLVCKTFVSRCQTHLYHEIRFGYLGDCEGSDRAERISKLADILDQSPHIGKHVRAIFLTLPEHDNTWIYSNLTFLRILPLITQHLQKLTIDGRVGSFIGDPEEAAIRFFIPFISPSISSLSLVLMNTFPLALLSAFLNLKILSLKFCGGFDQSVTPRATTNYPELQLLECSYGCDCLQALLPRGQWSPAIPVDLTALKIIKMYPRTENDIRITGQLVRAASSSLEEVFILRDEVTDWAPFDTGALSFNQTLRLKFIQLQFELQDPSASKNGLLGVINILQTISPENRLQNLEIDLYGRGTNPHCWYDVDWRAFGREIERITSGRGRSQPLVMNLYLEFLVPILHSYALPSVCSVIDAILQQLFLQLQTHSQVKLELFSRVE